MTHIDAGPEPIRLDEGGVERLRAALDRDAVAAAYLFGSQAAGTAGPLSDVDVAVWAQPELDADGRMALRLELMDGAATALGTTEIDVVMLDDASPLLRHRAWRGGRLLVDREPAVRVRGEARALVEYLDTAPLREELARGLEHRLAEDRFGRR